MKRKLYTVQGSFTDPDLPIDDLVDMDEMIYYHQIQPVPSTESFPVFIASDIEAIAVKVYQEYLAAKKLRVMEQLFKIDRFPLLKQKLDFFLNKNPKLAENNLFIRFLEEEIHQNVFVLSLFNDQNCKDKLNQLFREFYFEYRFMAYLSQVLYFEAVTFDKKQSLYHKREPLILEQPLGYDLETTLLDTLTTGTEAENYEITDETFDSYFTDENLYQVFKKLTNHQKKILTLAYVKELKDVEIAMVLNISQQAVSKTKKAALERIRKTMGVRK